ncbi:hypothetical protein K461DRAFT_306911 [Myriangium duriaei CBS 260.36]|uniref:Uncharacterized protein n=1 Tax=Myriangium duriaei CBS 260.36 TaxID=1168546 RepID=A0A9P4J1I6_9PEZI|nr:hypothetical protein K461DRAFT_306911 [Myriangium duriaei CBS 260.36]
MTKPTFNYQQLKELRRSYDHLKCKLEDVRQAFEGWKRYAKDANKVYQAHDREFWTTVDHSSRAAVDQHSARSADACKEEAMANRKIDKYMRARWDVQRQLEATKSKLSEELKRGCEYDRSQIDLWDSRIADWDRHKQKAKDNLARYEREYSRTRSRSARADLSSRINRERDEIDRARRKIRGYDDELKKWLRALKDKKQQATMSHHHHQQRIHDLRLAFHDADREIQQRRNEIAAWEQYRRAAQEQILRHSNTLRDARGRLSLSLVTSINANIRREQDKVDEANRRINGFMGLQRRAGQEEAINICGWSRRSPNVPSSDTWIESHRTIYSDIWIAFFELNFFVASAELYVRAEYHVSHLNLALVTPVPSHIAPQRLLPTTKGEHDTMRLRGRCLAVQQLSLDNQHSHKFRSGIQTALPRAGFNEHL